MVVVVEINENRVDVRLGIYRRIQVVFDEIGAVHQRFFGVSVFAQNRLHAQQNIRGGLIIEVLRVHIAEINP